MAGIRLTNTAIQVNTSEIIVSSPFFRPNIKTSRKKKAHSITSGVIRMKSDR